MNRDRTKQEENPPGGCDDYIEISRQEIGLFALGFVACLAFLTISSLGYATYYAGTQQIVSTITTGTAPITVESTTKVTNLNADLLDGNSSADLNNTPAWWSCAVDASSQDSGAGTNTGAAACTGNQKVIEGGCAWRFWGNSIDIIASFPTNQGWTCQTSSAGSNFSSSSTTGYANCCA